MKKSELLKNNGYWIAKIQIDLYNELSTFLSKNKMTQSAFAKKMGVSKGYISQVLNGDFDHRISKLVDLALAINKVPRVEFEDVDLIVKKAETGYKEIKWGVYSNNEDVDLDSSNYSGNEFEIKFITPYVDSNTKLVGNLS